MAKDPEKGRRRRAGALAALFAGATLAQIAAMIFSKPNKKDK